MLRIRASFTMLLGCFEFFTTVTTNCFDGTFQLLLEIFNLCNNSVIHRS